MSTKVGLVTVSSTPSPRAIPFAKRVFPDPSSPSRAIRVPGPQASPRRRPSDAVSSSDAVVISMAQPLPCSQPRAGSSSIVPSRRFRKTPRAATMAPTIRPRPAFSTRPARSAGTLKSSS